ncbi:hypothetical protein EMPS_09921 [Entomortierella parvispora]|uniref:Uncharacterized protein n=1 Tax=Entomortierella parvispora TaxID=205924 RepID=A0A9P3HJ27_9FUNG|nr:hypothetical protein EMPS_09921 [Entomortierella parvispora]
MQLGSCPMVIFLRKESRTSAKSTFIGPASPGKGQVAFVRLLEKSLQFPTKGQGSGCLLQKHVAGETSLLLATSDGRG